MDGKVFNPLGIPPGGYIEMELSNGKRVRFGILALEDKLLPPGNDNEYFLSFPDSVDEKAGGKKQPLRLKLSKDGAHVLYELLGKCLGLQYTTMTYDRLMAAEARRSKGTDNGS